MSGGDGRRRRLPRRRVVARGLVVLGLLTIALLGVVGWRASGVLELLLRRWTVEAVAQRSGGVYRLDVGRVRLNWLLRRVAVDAVRVTTDSGGLRTRTPPLPGLGATFEGCTLSGVHLVALVLGRGLVAESFGCRSGRLALSGVRRAPGEPDPRREDPPAAPRPPPTVPRVRIARVLFPDVALELRLPRADGGETRIGLERVRWRLVGFAIDPADSAAARRPLFSRVVELAVDSLVVRPDSFTAARIAHFRASLTDSTLDAEGLEYGPTGNLAEFSRRGPVRPDVVLVRSTRLRVQGADYAALALGLGVHAHRVTVDSLRVKVTSDYRGTLLPARHRTPQQWIADLGWTVDVDTIVVHGGEVEYREMRPDQAAPGVLTFSGIEATAASVHHVAGRRAGGDSLSLVAAATVLRAGRLDVRIAIPLDAPAFDMAFSGTLGPMPAPNFNRVLEHLENWRIARGHVERIDFRATVHRGVARGTLTPLYAGLSVEVTGHGSGGILGAGGIVGGAARGLASLVANWTKLKGGNPDRPGRPPRRGPIRHVFAPSETLPGFLWVSLREGLLAVLRP